MTYLNLFFAGLLAGAELLVCYGLRAALRGIDQQPHIQLRQALIRRLRILVPALFVPTAVTGIAVVVLHGSVFAWLGLAALLVWTLTTFLGTVPINQAAIEWDPADPPADWRAAVSRWERLDLVRCWAALAAFAAFLLGLAMQ